MGSSTAREKGVGRMNRRRWALWLVLALALAWVGGLASAADAAALRADPPLGAADSWAPASGSLAVAPLASSAVNRVVVAKHFGAGHALLLAQPLFPIRAAGLGPDGQTDRLSPSLICTPLRC